MKAKVSRLIAATVLESSPWKFWGVLTAMVVGMALLLACEPMEQTTGIGPQAADPPPVSGPPDPTPVPPPTPPSELVIEFSGDDATHTLSVPRAVFMRPGEQKSARVVLTAGGAADFDIVVGQRDSTAVVFEGSPIFYRRGLLGADETGLLADAVVVVPYTFEFSGAGSFAFGLPFRAKQAGRSLIQVIWTFGDGQKLGLATIEVVVE